MPGMPLAQVKLLPGSSAVILNFAGGSSGWRMIARLPTDSDLSSISTLVTDGVHSCHRSPSDNTSQTRCGAALISTEMLKSLMVVESLVSEAGMIPLDP